MNFWLNKIFAVAWFLIPYIKRNPRWIVFLISTRIICFNRSKIRTKKRYQHYHPAAAVYFNREALRRLSEILYINCLKNPIFFALHKILPLSFHIQSSNIYARARVHERGAKESPAAGILFSRGVISITALANPHIDCALYISLLFSSFSLPLKF